MLVWAMAAALLSLMAGANEVSMVPLTYVILTLLNIFIFQSKWGGEWCYGVQAFISVTMPFFFQAALGGVFLGGVIMLWASLAMMSSTVFLSRIDRFALLAIFVAEAIILAYMEYDVNQRLSVYIYQVIWFTTNFVLVTVALFFVAEHFIKQQMKMKHILYSVREKGEIMALELHGIEKDTHLAMKNALPSSLAFNMAFSDHFIAQYKGQVDNDNFLWLGNFYGNDIVVVMQSAISGVSSTLLALELKSQLNELVYRSGEFEAAQIMTHISEFLHGKERSIMTQSADYNLMVMTYDCTESKMTLATQGFDALIKEGSVCRNIDSICSSSVQCKTMKPIKEAYLKSVSLEEESHVLLYSKCFKKGSSGANKKMEMMFNNWISSDSEELHTLHKAMDHCMAEHVEEVPPLMHRMAIGLRLSMFD
jgi:hypothetical protein